MTYLWFLSGKQYGEDEGKFVVVTSDGEHELTGPVTEEEGAKFIAELTSKKKILQVLREVTDDLEAKHEGDMAVIVLAREILSENERREP